VRAAHLLDLIVWSNRPIFYSIFFGLKWSP